MGAMDTWQQSSQETVTPGKTIMGGASLLASLVPKPPHEHAMPSVLIQRVGNCKRLTKQYLISSDSEEDCT